MNVYLYQNNTEKILKNIYIGEYGWKPWANTLLYCPLDTANWTNDITWNYTLSSAKITTLSWIECLHIGKNYSQIYTTTNFPYSSSSIFTVNVWGRCDDTSKYVQFAGRWSDNPVIYNWMLANTQSICWGSTNYITQVTPKTWWHNYCAVFNGNQYPIMYIDGVEVSRSWTRFGTSHVGAAPLYIWDTTWSITDGYVNRVIIESVARTVQEISDYYNQTKSNYWL